jgi:hypothetical protein
MIITIRLYHDPRCGWRFIARIEGGRAWTCVFAEKIEI